MPAVFDNCPACLTSTTIDQQKRGSVLAVYTSCKTCRLWHIGLLATAIVAGLLSLVPVVGAYPRFEISVALNAASSILTIFGGYLIFGKLELLLLVGRTLGGYHEPVHMALLAEETKRARLGLLLVIAGLLAQAWS